MKVYTFLFFSFCCSFVFGQLPIYQGDFQFNSFKNDSSKAKKHYSALITENFVTSNAITNGFINKALGDGFLSDEDKQQVLDKLKTNNRLGTALDVNIICKQQLEKFTLVGALRGRNYRHMYFTDDMFELLMYGNKPFEGKTANLAPTRIYQSVHEEIYLGVEKFLDSTKLLIGGGIGFQNISYTQNKHLTRASLYTAPQGRSLDFDVAFLNEESDRSGSEFTRNVGWGATLNLYAIKELKNGNQLSIELRDFGFNKVDYVRAFEVDSSYNFEGIEATEFFNFSNSGFEDPTNQDIDELLGLERTKYSKTYLTVSSIHLSYKHNFSDKFYSYAGIRQLFPAPYVPLVYVKPYYAPTHFIAVGPSLAYGGFGNFDLGISFKGTISKTIFFTYDFLYLETLLTPNNSTGQGFNFSLSAIF